jgi:hypothetical protein
LATADSPAVYNDIPEASEINFRTGSATVIDVTDLASLAKEKRMGLQDEGQCTFTLNLLPKEATHAELIVAKADRLLRNFRVTLTDTPSPTQYWFSGFVLSVPLAAGVDNVIKSSVVVEISGVVSEEAP